MIRIIQDEQDIVGLLERKQSGREKETAAVREIIADVRVRGDEAVLEYTMRFDRVALTAETMRVTQEEIEEAYRQVDDALLTALREAAENIRNFHEKQKVSTWTDTVGGRTVGQLINPVGAVGVYVPGGAAAYPSSVLMNVLPAKVAGVEKIIMVTPHGKDGGILPLTLVAAAEAGADEIYKIGGAQAVAALAFGTQSIPRVDKIVGPGNIYVALAKREVFGHVGIDMIAGPSEILVIADHTANPAYVAADMLSQCEHDPLAAAWLLTDNEQLAAQTSVELEKQLNKLGRAEIARAAAENNGAIILVKDIEQAMECANRIAPEHMELCVEHPEQWLGKVRNAGAVFLGHYSPEPLGDYFAGPNHVLPTSGTARFSSPLGVDDFIKKTSIISYTREELEKASGTIIRLAQTEGLTAHANAVGIRFEK